MSLTADQLRQSVEHIQFEADRLFFCWQAEKRIGRTPVDAPNHDVRAALREAILLHCRVLLAFLFHPLICKPRSDDLFASLFFDQPDDWQPPMPDWLESHYKRLHKMLAHLTYGRVEMIRMHGRGWKVDRLVELALREWNRFAEVVPRRWRGAFRAVPAATAS
jgi:hypothetical protein